MNILFSHFYLMDIPYTVHNQSHELPASLRLLCTAPASPLTASLRTATPADLPVPNASCLFEGGGRLDVFVLLPKYESACLANPPGPAKGEDRGAEVTLPKPA